MLPFTYLFATGNGFLVAFNASSFIKCVGKLAVLTLRVRKPPTYPMANMLAGYIPGACNLAYLVRMSPDSKMAYVVWNIYLVDWWMAHNEQRIQRPATIKKPFKCQSLSVTHFCSARLKFKPQKRLIGFYEVP